MYYSTTQMVQSESILWMMSCSAALAPDVGQWLMYSRSPMPHTPVISSVFLPCPGEQLTQVRERGNGLDANDSRQDVLECPNKQI